MAARFAEQGAQVIVLEPLAHSKPLLALGAGLAGNHRLTSGTVLQNRMEVFAESFGCCAKFRSFQNRLGPNRGVLEGGLGYAFDQQYAIRV